MMRPIRYKEAPKAKVKAKAAKGAKPAKAGTASQRGGGPEKQVAKKWFQQAWGVVLIGVLIFAGIFGVIAILVGAGIIPNPFSVAPTPPPTTPTTPTTYSISVWDGAINRELDPASFDYKLYGTNTSDFADFDLLESGNDLSDISNGDMTDPSTDDTYTTFWVEFNGTQEHDDDIFGSSNNRGERVYGIRWTMIGPNQANDLITYETPNVVAMILWNSNNGTIYSTLGAGDVKVGVNITIAIMTNATQTTAMFVPYFNPFLETQVEITATARFNDVIGTGDFRLAGSSGVRQSGNVEIRFTLGALMPGTILLSGTWRGPTISNPADYLDAMDLDFGEDTIVAIS